jgi:hypothetical protein
MNKAMTTALLLAVAATGACNRPSGGNNAANTANAAAAAPATTNAGAAAPGAAAQAGQSEAEVRAFLDRIYAPYATDGGTGADYATILEPQLAAALEKTEGGIDADPFIDAQDWTALRPTYENVAVNGDRATATASFTNGGTATRIDYQMLRTAAGWKVYDVQSANGGSLRERIMNSAQ